MKDQDPPAFTGPSEFGQSVSISVNPDSLPQDGASQSVVMVTVRDKDSAPMRNVTLRVETRVAGTAVDFGQLSARSIVTDANGRATLIYTAPMAPAVSVDTFTIVDIGATPVGTDFNNAVLRTAAIRLTPPGIIVPPSNLRPSFTVTPSALAVGQVGLFNASASEGSIVEYRWSFGDGESGNGVTEQHDYAAADTYIVTLTVVDAYGRTASTSQSIQVGSPSQTPVASFTAVPNPVRVGTPVTLNATNSRPGQGGTIVSYTWDFGDGTTTTASSPITTKTFATAQTYNVRLFVTDSLNRVSQVTPVSVTVTP